MLHLKHYRWIEMLSKCEEEKNNQTFGISLVHIPVPFKRSTFASGKGCLTASFFTDLIVFMVRCKERTDCVESWPRRHLDFGFTTLEIGAPSSLLIDPVSWVHIHLQHLHDPLITSCTINELIQWQFPYVKTYQAQHNSFFKFEMRRTRILIQK